MTDREKLIELMEQAYYCSIEELADHLIANGVVVREWIPFDDIKPKDGQSVLGITTEGEMEVYQFDAEWKHCLCKYGGHVKTFNITHWMPLPEPPKEVE